MIRNRPRTILALVALLATGLFAAWYFGWYSTGPKKPRGYGPRAVGPDELYSNILPDDYVGPQKCGSCHKDQFQDWSTHPHRFMNQLPNETSIKGDFADHVWTVRPGSTVTFSTKGSDYLMTVDRPEKKRTQYRVTRTVGSRFVQFYIGVQTEGEPVGDDRALTTEHKLPFGYWFRMKRWLPVDYFDVSGGDYQEDLEDGLPVVPGVDSKPSFIAYTASCLHCHNTYPHSYRIFRETLRGFPDAVVDPDVKPLSTALAKWVNVKPNEEAFADLPYRINPNKDLVTVGISCESCHMGGREHATLKKDISFFPTHPNVSMKARLPHKPFDGKRLDPATSQGICAQCHSARAVSTYPNGARVRNSCESLDLAEGSCTSQIRCVTCHEPHTPGVPSGGPTLTRYLDACVACHAQYSTNEQVAAHSRHSAKSGVDCLDCHMPRISQGIDEVSRTHRISLPVEQSMISARANACNLCHLEKSVRWSLDEVQRGWGKTISPLDSTPPEFLDEPAGKVWGKSAESMTRITAVDAYARSSRWKDNLPNMMDALNDNNPTNRAYALFAVERILDRRLSADDYDVRAGPARRREQIDVLRSVLEKKR